MPYAKKNLSAKEKKACAYAWVFEPYKDCDGGRRVEAQAPKGAHKSRSLVYMRRARLSREVFTAVFKVARRFRAVGAQVLYVPSDDYRASVVVPKKVAPLAVSRNYIRRRVYALLATLHTKEALSGHVIIMFLPESKKIPLRDVLLSIETTLRTHLGTHLPPKKDMR